RPVQHHQYRCAVYGKSVAVVSYALELLPRCDVARLDRGGERLDRLEIGAFERCARGTFFHARDRELEGVALEQVLGALAGSWRDGLPLEKSLHHLEQVAGMERLLDVAVVVPDRDRRQTESGQEQQLGRRL